MKSSRVQSDLIIGASSQAGIVLARLLRNRGRHVCGISRSDVYQHFFNEFYQCDFVKDFKSLVPKLCLNKYDNIYYLIAVNNSTLNGGNNGLDLKIFLDANFFPFEYLINFLVDNKIHPKVIFPGTSQFFQGNLTMKQNENSPMFPDKMNPYALSKMQGLMLLEDHVKDIPFIVPIFFPFDTIYRKNDFLSMRIFNNVHLNLSGVKNILDLGADSKVDLSSGYEILEALIQLLENDFCGKIVMSSGNYFKISKHFETLYARKGLQILDCLRFSSKTSFDSLFGDNTTLKKMLPDLNFTTTPKFYFHLYNEKFGC